MNKGHVVLAIILIIGLSIIIFGGYPAKQIFASVTPDLIPIKDGFYRHWTPSTPRLAHFPNVDETPCDGSWSYNYTNGYYARDTYGIDISSVPVGSIITKIEIIPCASLNSTKRKDGPSVASSFSVFYRLNGVNSRDSLPFKLPKNNIPAPLPPVKFDKLKLGVVGNSNLEIGVYYAGGNLGVRVSRLSAVVTYEILSAPTSLDAVNISSSQNNLTWQDNSNNETGFKIERSLNNSNGPFVKVATVGKDVVSYSDINLTADQTYYYQVKSYNSVTDSPPSNIDYAVTSSKAPSAPSNFDVMNPASDQNDLTWKDNSNNEDGFKIEMSLNNQFSGFSEIASTPMDVNYFSDLNLQADQTYFYKVRAYNAIGNSSYSATDYGITATMVPNDLSNFNGTATGTSATLTWTDTSTNEETIRIERSADNITFTEVAVKGINSISHVDVNLSKGTYYYKARARNVIGDSNYTSTVTVVIN
ncbi:MAG: fibronectin type III domain-containing protein [Candidatus Pacebacteria bacterium]|nr:fibronectin type III domain-containing protein [Candidatus Paceibacterota bacterium]